MDGQNKKLLKKGKGTQSFVSIFWELFGRLPCSRKRQFWLLLGYMILVSLVATASACSIALFASAFSSPEETFNSKYILMAQDILQLDILRSPKGIMFALSFLMVFLLALKNLFDVLLLYFVARYGAAIEAYFGVMLFKGFLHMPYEWHLNQNSADLVLALQWRSYLGHSFFNTALRSLSDVFLVTFLMIAVFMASPQVSLAVFVLSGIVAYLIYRKLHVLQEREAERAKNFAISVNRQATKGIHGIKDVKVSGQTSFLNDFQVDTYGMARIQGMRSFYGRMPIGLLETIGFSILAGVIIVMLYFTHYSTAEVTAIISLLIVAAWRILPAMSRIMTDFLTIRNIVPFIRVQLSHLRDIETHAVYAPMIDEVSHEELNFNHEIQLRDISFSYQNRDLDVLDQINFTIKKGQTIGIVGCSGVGKSTLVDIIIGLLKPSQGSVLIDGTEINVAKRYAWMKKLSYVPQSPYICDGTIAANIAFGVPGQDIDRDFVLECCRMAYMQDILDALPQGIDTIIGERGMRLSGGQRQRVAIARALYTRPELMIFDEATSSLDSKSENAIQETINSLKGMKTLIIVAHRLLTVNKADSLVWMEAGKVRMMGETEQVLEKYEESLR